MLGNFYTGRFKKYDHYMRTGVAYLIPLSQEKLPQMKHFSRISPCFLFCKTILDFHFFVIFCQGFASFLFIMTYFLLYFTTVESFLLWHLCKQIWNKFSVRNIIFIIFNMLIGSFDVLLFFDDYLQWTVQQQLVWTGNVYKCIVVE